VHLSSFLILFQVLLIYNLLFVFRLISMTQQIIHLCIVNLLLTNYIRNIVYHWGTGRGINGILT
jgi:hypothetical protein